MEPLEAGTTYEAGPPDGRDPDHRRAVEARPTSRGLRLAPATTHQYRRSPLV